jgi:hypothetical protein
MFFSARRIGSTPVSSTPAHSQACADCVHLSAKLAQTAYTCLRWTGHLLQGRFSSVALDEAHLVAAARYVALNPVRARPVARAQDWAWSSARAHLAGRGDGLVRVAPLIERLGRFADLIEAETELEHVPFVWNRNML